jgi:integrase
MEFLEIATEWKIEKKKYVKKSSYAAYALLVENHLMPAFGNKHQVSESDIQNFVLQKLDTGLSQKTVKDMLIVLKMIFKFAFKNKLAEMPSFDIQFPTEHKKQEIEVLSIGEQKKIMNYTQEHFTFRNLGIYICLCSGIRIGEVCAITWGNLNTEKGVICVRQTIQRIYNVGNEEQKTELIIDSPKTRNSIREIPMNRKLLQMLKPIKKIVNPNYFVLTNDTRPTEPRTYRNYFKKLMNELELPAIKFHGLRHSFATRCIESKCDYKTVSVLLGHSNISTTLNLYVHPNLEQKQKAINQMFRSLK